MKKHFSKVVASLLCLFMVVSSLPLTAFAANSYVASTTDDYYKLVSKQDWELAPGVTESEIVLNNDAGSHRQVAHVVEVDTNNEYTKVMPSYRGMAAGLNAKEYAVQVMSEQTAYAEANGYGNVVAAMNISLSWYNSDYYSAHPELVGEPLGYLVMDGVYYENSQGKTDGAETCLVINFDEKDSIARPAGIPKVEIRSTSDDITGWEEQVIPANFGFLVKDGVNQYSQDHDSRNGASRSFVGIKADGTIVMVMNDGRQAPYSTGFTSYEMAEFMLSLGCVQAINGDGGGSSTFLSQRPGEELKLNCAPSDGAERDTTHGILVISTAPVTGEFQRATISSEYDYYTPNSTVSFSAVGSDLVGTATEIPAGATWQLADSSFGTIDENGVFVSNGKEGDVIVQIVYDENIVGEDTIHIVMPDKISVVQTNMVVPYGTTVDLGLSATYDSKTVCIKASDITCVLSDDEIGTIDGFSFTAAQEGTSHTKSDLTITLGELSIDLVLLLGKGSEIVYDFETDHDLSNWYIGSWYPQYGPGGSNKDESGNYYYNGQNEIGALSIVTSANGKVKNGEYALAAFCDFTQTYETGYLGVKFLFPEEIDCTDAIAVGFWMYIPYDARHAEIRLVANNSASTVYDNGELWNFVEGWNYIKLDITQLANKTFQGFNIQVDDRACASTGEYYNYISEPNLNGKYTFYIDDITLDYSTAVDDRETPIFSGLQGLNGENGFELDGQTISNNKLSFEVGVNENTTQSNATGLNTASAKAYIDGKKVDCTYSNGKISIVDVVLSNGIHTVKFEISDNAGNSSWISGTVNVAAENDCSTIEVVPQDPTADRLKIGSLYWMDVKATDIETVDRVEMVFDLNNASSWELAGLNVAEGFSATWSIQKDENLATIVITRTGQNEATGEAVLASFPVRTWVSTITECEGYEDQMPAKLVSRGIIWAQSIELQLKTGIINYVDGYANKTTGTFGMEDVLVDTELFFTNYSRKNVEGAQAWIDACKATGIGFHEHTVTTLTDKNVTCTEDGYTGRTYCEVCQSVVDWGTTVEATEHRYEVREGKLVCDCGEQYIATGLVEVDGTYYYMIAGNLRSGWHMIGNNWHYFRSGIYSAATGTRYYFSEFPYEFDETGRLLHVVWRKYGDSYRCYYGPTFYSGTAMGTWIVIEGKQYCFAPGGRVLIGYQTLRSSFNAPYRLHQFNSKGVYIGEVTDYNGFVDGFDGIRYYVDGEMQHGLQIIDGEFYYFSASTGAARTGKYTVTVANSNGLLKKNTTFNFDAKTGAAAEKPLNGFITENGNTYYYIDNVAQKGLQLIDGSYYYFSINTGIMRTGKYIVTVANSNGLLTKRMTFNFDTETGAAAEKPLNGFVTENGNTYYYIDNVEKKGLQLIDGSYYYFSINTGIMRTGKYTVTVANSNGLLTKNTTFNFDAETGAAAEKPLNGFVTKTGNTYYYINNVVQKGLQLIDDSYYYFSINTGIMRTGKYTVTVANSNGLLTKNTTFNFDVETGAATEKP